jgi:hypothetical protein
MSSLVNAQIIQAKIRGCPEARPYRPVAVHPFSHELHPENPTRCCLTGYMVLDSAPLQHRSDAEAQDGLDAAASGASAEPWAG